MAYFTSRLSAIRTCGSVAGPELPSAGDAATSKRWSEAACEGCQELRAFNPTVADCWLGRALMGLRDKLGAIEAYESALRQQLLYPARREVEKILLPLKGKGWKSCGG